MKNISLIPLVNYSSMLEVALETEYIRPEDIDTLQEWRKDPANWVPRRQGINIIINLININISIWQHTEVRM